MRLDDPVTIICDLQRNKNNNKVENQTIEGQRLLADC